MRPRVLIFDRKRDFRCLVRYLPDFVYVPLPRFRDNLLRGPAGVEPKLWMHVLLEVLGQQLDMRVAVRGLIAQLVLWLYKMYGYTGRVEEPCPCISDLREKLETAKPKGWREQAYVESAQNRMRSLDDIGPYFEVSKGMGESVYKADCNLGFDLVGLPTDFQSVVIAVLVAKLFVYRLATGVRNPAVAVCLDEAQAVFRRKAEQQDGGFYLADLVQQGRELNVAVIAAAQSLTDLSSALQANTATKILAGGW